MIATVGPPEIVMSVLKSALVHVMSSKERMEDFRNIAKDVTGMNDDEFNIGVSIAMKWVMAHDGWNHTSEAVESHK